MKTNILGILIDDSESTQILSGHSIIKYNSSYNEVSYTYCRCFKSNNNPPRASGFYIKFKKK